MMISKLGIWLDSNSALVVKSQDKKLNASEIHANNHRVDGLLKSPVQTIKNWLHMNGNQVSSDSIRFSNYISAILRQVEDPEEVYIFGDARMEEILIQHMSSSLKIKLKKLEVYPVESLSPDLRFRQIKAFLN